jgi:hypothetical protein
MTTSKPSKLWTAARVALLAAFAAWVSPGCIEPGPRINRVQTNLIDKSVFEGEWWFTHTVIDVADDAAWAIGMAGAGAPWPGATASFDIASNSGVVGRIRWVIDENFLYAYRTNEIVLGSSPDARDPDFRGQPLAAYRILAHVDVRQDYNPVTGEPGNVVTENTDRRWFDRRFVRVDWSRNLVTFGLFGASLEIDELFGSFRREPALGIVDEGNTDLPPEWAPQFARVSDEQPCDQTGRGEGACYRFFEEWPADQRETVHYMSFVTQELWTPTNCFGSLCNTSVTVTVRDAFLRVPPLHEYAVETLANSEYDRFGIIRTESRTYLRGGGDRSTLGRYCDTDSDCDPACADGDVACEVHCDVSQHLCVGGLLNEHGETDFLTFYRLRHNFYSDSLTDQSCIADWQCSARYTGYRCRGTTPDGGTCSVFGGDESACTSTPGCSWHPANGGSVCDPFARRCTIPLAERPIRQVRYTLSPHYPAYLVRSAFETIASWNEALMRGAREQREGLPDARFGGANTPPPPTGPAVPCQGDDPTLYCYCNGSFLAAEVDPSSRTCAHRTNWFVRPEERGETNPYQCWIEGPADVRNPTSFADYERDEDGDGVWDHYEYRMVGPECMLVLDVNECDRNPGAPCQQLGDLRYQFFNYVSGAGAGWCGVMQPNQDPHTGEAIISPVNMGGLCLDSISQQAINIWPILRGEEPADPLFQGEEIRAYFDRLSRVRNPVGLAPGAAGGSVEGGPRPALPVDIQARFEAMMERAAPRIRDLHGPEARARLMSDRLLRAAGTALEHRLVDGVAAETYSALMTRPEDRLGARQMGSPGIAPEQLVRTRGGVWVSDDVLDRVSPFRDDFIDEITADRRRMQLIEQTGTCMLFKDEYQLISQFGVYWANAFAGRPVAEARIRWAQAWHRAVMKHEMGHGLGLEHNFAATLDRDHYHPPYFRLEDELPLPEMNDFDMNRDGAITDVEANAWLAEFQRVRNERNARGMGNWTASSTMDYAGDLSDIMDIGFYDRAAIYFNYFNLVETFQGDPRFSDPTSSRDGLLRSDRHGRDLWTWYRGGEQCRADVDCPYTAGSRALAPGQVVYQRCVSNPRFSSIPIPCAEIGDPEAARHCICSNFDEDMADFVAGAAYTEARDRDGDGSLDYYPVQYMFCSNPRLDDISWCNAFDAGESFLEVIANMRLAWEQSYPFSYFRRFRRPFYAGARSLRWVPDAAKIYQHLFFRYFYEPRFRSNTGPLGLADQYLASIEAMNFMAYLASTPDVGSYRRNPVTGVWEHMGTEIGMSGSAFSLEPGQGFYMWSAYQEGLLGFFRLERAGMFFDKLIALRALTLRDWNLRFTIDERFFINFYDLFPIEMTELFGGYVIDDPSWYAPRVEIEDGRPVVSYLNLFRASYGCANPSTGRPRPCRGPNSVAFRGTPLGGTSNDVLRVYAAMFALAEFPVFYDTTWEQRLAVFKLGNADGFDIPDVQPSGRPTCAYGTVPADRIEPSHDLCADPNDADYILYRSDRLHTTYVAVKVRPRIEFNLEEEQLGFQLLYQMTQNQRRIVELEGLPTRTADQERELALRRRTLERNESFLETLIEVQRIFGITSWL